MCNELNYIFQCSLFKRNYSICIFILWQTILSITSIMNSKSISFFNHYVNKNTCMALHTILYTCIVKLLHHDDRNMKGNNMYK